MAVTPRSQATHTDPATTAPPSPAPPSQAPPAREPAVSPSAVSPSASPTTRVPRTRTGAAWLAICVAALTFVVLIIFMLQNTRSVEVTFLWMHGTLPLALALLIAGIGCAILAMVVAAGRITQLRRLAGRTRR